MHFALAPRPSARDEIGGRDSRLGGCPRASIAQAEAPAPSVFIATRFDRFTPSVFPPSLRTHCYCTQHTSLIIPAFISMPQAASWSEGMGIAASSPERAFPSIRGYERTEGSTDPTRELERSIARSSFTNSNPLRKLVEDVSLVALSCSALSDPLSLADWARSFLGYPPVQVADPNPTHYAISALQTMGVVNQVITQVRPLSSFSTTHR